MDGPYVAGNLDFDPLNLYKSLGDNAAGRKGMRELEVGREGKVKKWKKVDTSWLVVRVAITDLTLTPTLFFFLSDSPFSFVTLSILWCGYVCVCVTFLLLAVAVVDSDSYPYYHSSCYSSGTARACGHAGPHQLGAARGNVPHPHHGHRSVLL